MTVFGNEEASAAARAAARELRDNYVAMRAEGFTEREALAIIGQILAAAFRPPEDQ